MPSRDQESAVGKLLIASACNLILYMPLNRPCRMLYRVLQVAGAGCGVQR